MGDRFALEKCYYCGHLEFCVNGICADCFMKKETEKQQDEMNQLRKWQFWGNFIKAGNSLINLTTIRTLFVNGRAIHMTEVFRDHVIALFVYETNEEAEKAFNLLKAELRGKAAL